VGYRRVIIRLLFYRPEWVYWAAFIDPVTSRTVEELELGNLFFGQNKVIGKYA